MTRLNSLATQATMPADISVHETLEVRHDAVGHGHAARMLWGVVYYMLPHPRRLPYCAYTIYIRRDLENSHDGSTIWSSEHLLWRTMILTGIPYAAIRDHIHRTGSELTLASAEKFFHPDNPYPNVSNPYPNTSRLPEEHHVDIEAINSNSSSSTVVDQGPDVWNQAIMKCILEGDERDLHALTGDREPGTRDIVVDVCDWDQKTILGTILISIGADKKWKSGAPSTPYAWVVLTMLYRFGANEVLSEEEWVRRCKRAEEYLEEHGWVPGDVAQAQAVADAEAKVWREGLDGPGDGPGEQRGDQSLANTPD